MENLFHSQDKSGAPLPERLRPTHWDDYVGHSEVCNQIRKMPLHSMILYGPPGCGKTTLAKILATHSGLEFYFLSAISCGVKEIREVIAKGRMGILNLQKPVVLFLDEIHRFSKSQQDALLEAVEAGWVLLIGATTQNPAFEVISPLLSRCRVYRLKALQMEDLEHIFNKAVSDPSQPIRVDFEDDAKQTLIEASSGDARRLLGCIEASRLFVETGTKVGKKDVLTILEGQLRNYDKAGGNHYDFISAFIKSMRGSDPDATLVYLAAMIEAGEDPLFIARRMLIFSSEDIGNASPTAMSMALAAYQSVERIGMPESRIILSQTAVFLASSPKSNASYLAINKALEDIKNRKIEIPNHLRNAPTQIHAEEGAGQDYQYPHNQPQSFIKTNYFPEGFEGQVYYWPTQNGQEERIKERLNELWEERYTKNN